MLAFTRDAARAIRQVMAAESADGVRVHAGARTIEMVDGLEVYTRARRFDRASAPSIQIEAAYGDAVEEVVLEADGARVYVDAETMRLLDDKVLDADLTAAEPRFAVFQPTEPLPA